MILWGGLLCNGSPPFIKSSEKYKWNVRTVRGTMGSGKFEFCDLLYGYITLFIGCVIGCLFIHSRKYVKALEIHIGSFFSWKSGTRNLAVFSKVTNLNIILIKW